MDEHPHRIRPVPLALSVLVALTAVAAAAMYLFPELQASRRSLTLASSFLPYGVLAWGLAALLMLAATRGRSRWLAAPLVVGLLAHSLMIAAYFDPTHRAPSGTRPTLRLMALNLHYGQADLVQLLAEAKRVQPDVLVLTEFTGQAGEVLTAPEWRTLLPYNAGTTGRTAGKYDLDASGTQVLSRNPLTELARTQGTRATSIAVRTTAAGRSFVLVAAHPANMLSEGRDGWLDESRDVLALARGYTDGPLVLAGDLNSVPEHVTLRTLMAGTGLHECLTGWQPTFPANRLVPLIRIDHVLASAQFSTVATRTFAARGTDHRGVVAELAQA